MEITPRKSMSKLSLASKRTNSELRDESIVISQPSATGCPSSTPINKKTSNEDEESPTVYTQELSNDIDVVWDWNSPQDKRRFKKKKRLNLGESPKVPFRRYPSNTQVQSFEKLREELRALREEIAVPENEDCLVLSPMDETEYKDESNIQGNLIDDPTEDPNVPENESEAGLFDDSVDEQLILFSQRIESDMLEKPRSRDTKIHNIPNSVKEKDVLDDSLNQVFSQMDDDLELTQVIDLKSAANIIPKTTLHLPAVRSATRKGTFEKSKSNNNLHILSTGKVEFCRTQSFELANQRAEVILSRSTLEEIERKRKEALAKRENKRRQDSNNYSPSPTKCSPEEIERKRLQALAKLEAKKQNEIIERNRQEALLRLQMNRMKNANNVKSTLVKRL